MRVDPHEDRLIGRGVERSGWIEGQLKRQMQSGIEVQPDQGQETGPQSRQHIDPAGSKPRPTIRSRGRSTQPKSDQRHNKTNAAALLKQTKLAE